MKVTFTKNGLDDYTYWQENDKKLNKRLNKLLREILRNPYTGIGKPEPLKGTLAGFHSRRINQEHRLVYEILKSEIVIHQCRYHY